MNVNQKLIHAVTAYDQKQEAKARAKPQHHYNTYALPQYLGRVADVIADIDAGAAVDAAIIAGFTVGPLRTACLKACGFGANKSESSGSYKGMPVYQPVSSKG